MTVTSVERNLLYVRIYFVSPPYFGFNFKCNMCASQLFLLHHSSTNLYEHPSLQNFYSFIILWRVHIHNIFFAFFLNFFTVLYLLFSTQNLQFQRGSYMVPSPQPHTHHFVPSQLGLHCNLIHLWYVHTGAVHSTIPKK